MGRRGGDRKVVPTGREWLIRYLLVLRAAVLLSMLLHARSADGACTNGINNGQVADATAVMGNSDALKGCADSAVTPTGTPAAGNIAAFFSSGPITSGNLSGDGTTSGTLAVTCTESNGTTFEYFATGSDGGQLTGTVSINRFNGGANADNSHFLRGDGTWATRPSGGGGVSSTIPPIDVSVGVSAASSFMTFNFGAGKTLSDSAGKALWIRATNSRTGIQRAAKSTPTAPYRLFILAQDAVLGNDSWPAIGFQDSTSGKLQLILNNGIQFAVQSFNSPTSLAIQQRIQDTDAGGDFLYVLEDDGTNVSLGLRRDGVNVVSLYSVAKASGFLGLSGYNQLFFAVRQNDGPASLLTIHCWDAASLTRSFS
jgi:hypothetical protein